MRWSPFKPAEPDRRYKTRDGEYLERLPKSGYFFYTMKTIQQSTAVPPHPNPVTIVMKPVTVSVPLPNDPPPPYFSAGFYTKGTEYFHLPKHTLEEGLKKLVSLIEQRMECKAGSNDYKHIQTEIDQLVSEFHLPYHCRKEHTRYDLHDIGKYVKSLAKRYPVKEWMPILNKVAQNESEVRLGVALRGWEEKMRNQQIIWHGHEHHDAN
ncbi:MAG: hypothetical protein Q9222_001973 [Ikaeria aurantiellina]